MLGAEPILKYPVVFLIALFGTAGVIPLLIPLGLRLGLVAHPNERRAHDGDVPTVGGIAVFLGFHLACASVFLVPWSEFAAELGTDWWIRFLPLSAAVLSLGLIDDVRDLSPAAKLAGQVAIALAAFYVGFRVESVAGTQLPTWLDLVVTVGWIVLIVNAFNLVDGIDGLSAGLAAVAALGMGAALLLRRLPGDVLILIALFGACAGFLRHNLRPSTVFLGDAGSMFLGFSVAVLGLATTSMGNTIASIAVPLMAVGVPVLDTFLAVWRRSCRRVLKSVAGEGAVTAARGLFSPDREHIHHRFVSKGVSHKKVAVRLWLLAAVLVAGALLLQTDHARVEALLLLSVLGVAYAIFGHIADIEMEMSGQLMARGVARWSHHVAGRLVYVVADVGAIALAFFLVTNVAPIEQGPGVEAGDWLPIALARVAVPFMILAVTRNYDIVWSSARPSDVLKIGALVAVGCFLARGVQGLVWNGVSPAWTLMHEAIFASLAAAWVMVTRVARAALTNPSPEVPADGSRENQLAVAVYGVTPGVGEMVSWLRKSHGETGLVIDVKGFITDDHRLFGRTLAGCPVLGDVEGISPALDRLGVRVIVTASVLSDERRRALAEVTRVSGVHLWEWSPTAMAQKKDPPIGMHSGPWVDGGSVAAS